MIEGFSKRLHISRENCKLTRKQVAELIGCSESLIGLYETGNRQPPLSTLIKLVSIYKVSSDYLLGCETTDKEFLSLSGLNDKQIAALKMTADCFRNFNG